MYVWRTLGLPFVISIFLKKQENRISEKNDIWRLAYTGFPKYPYGRVFEYPSVISVTGNHRFWFAIWTLLNTAVTKFFRPSKHCILQVIFLNCTETLKTVFLVSKRGSDWSMKGKADRSLYIVDAQWLLPSKKKKKKVRVGILGWKN